MRSAPGLGLMIRFFKSQYERGIMGVNSPRYRFAIGGTKHSGGEDEVFDCLKEGGEEVGKLVKKIRRKTIK